MPTVSLDVALHGARSFAEQRAAAGFGPAQTKLGLWVHCADSTEAARPVAERHLTQLVDAALRHYELANGHFASLRSNALPAMLVRPS